MRNLTINIAVRYVRSTAWGWNPSVTVMASLDGVRNDTTCGSASGCGYDKLSTAVCNAFSVNPLTQTLLLWDGWKKDTEKYGTQPIQGNCWNFDGQGMGVLLKNLCENGFKVTETCDMQGNPIGYTASRDMPSSFVAIV